MVEELLRRGADVDGDPDMERQCFNAIPLHNASAAGHVGTVKLLLAAKANVGALDEDGCGCHMTLITSPMRLQSPLMTSDDF